MEELKMKKEHNNKTELVFILDRSGSMSGLEADTIGGFNSMIDKQRRQDGECLITTILFDHEIEFLHDRVSLDDIGHLTEKDYSVRGSTALIDAIGTAVDHIEKIHKYARREDVPENTMFVITTDGYENASHVYSSDKVKKMIETKKKKNGWEFLFIGANIDAVETARHFGIAEDRAVNYNADQKGTAILYEAVSDAVCCFRAAQPMKKSWSKKIREDHEKRKTGGK